MDGQGCWYGALQEVAKLAQARTAACGSQSFPCPRSSRYGQVGLANPSLHPALQAQAHQAQQPTSVQHGQLSAPACSLTCTQGSTASSAGHSMPLQTLVKKTCLQFSAGHQATTQRCWYSTRVRAGVIQGTPGRSPRPWRIHKQAMLLPNGTGAT